MSPRLFTPTPYPLTETAIGYTFTTDLGEQYVIYYAPAIDYFPGLAVGEHALMFGFSRVVPEGQEMDDDTPPDDPRIKPTIIQEILKTLEDKTKVLVYVCQDGKRHRAIYRHRLFGRWFRELKNSRLTRSIVYEENGLYASIIYSADNPFAYNLKDELPTLDEKIDYITSQDIE